MSNNFYNFKAKSLQGKEIEMKEFEGKVVLVVNTASKCGFTPQFTGLEKLYEKYKDNGLIILGFPCNQFGNQEPGSEKDIAEGCMINYGVTFPMFSKVDVNGQNAHPIFKYLKKKKGGILGNKIKWNFTKFLINPKGEPMKRFGSIITPEKLEPEIKKLLATR